MTYNSLNCTRRRRQIGGILSPGLPLFRSDLATVRIVHARADRGHAIAATRSRGHRRTWADPEGVKGAPLRFCAGAIDAVLAPLIEAIVQRSEDRFHSNI
jgi:hypothetical protein